MNGTYETSNSLRAPLDELARTPDPVDSVHLSTDALVQRLQHVAYSLNLKTEKLQNEIKDLAISYLG